MEHAPKEAQLRVSTGEAMIVSHAGLFSSMGGNEWHLARVNQLGDALLFF